MGAIVVRRLSDSPDDFAILDTPLPWARQRSRKATASVGLELVVRKSYTEAGRSWVGLNAQMAPMLPHNAHGIVESKPEALSRSLGREEGLEDAVLQIHWNTRACVPDFHQQHLAL